MFFSCFEYLGPNGNVDGLFVFICAKYHIQVVELHISETEFERFCLEGAQTAFYGAGIDHVLVVMIFDGHLMRHKFEGGGDVYISNGYFSTPFFT